MSIPKPSYLSPTLDTIPHELRAVDQWVVWCGEWQPGKDDKPGKWTKVPKSAKSGRSASSTGPATWASFDAAVAAYQRNGGFDGVGFVFTSEDQYLGIDLDGCRDPQTGELTPEASEWVRRFATYAEVSPSGTGVKMIGVGALPEGMSGRRNAGQGVEVYDRGRYFTLTGRRVEGAPDGPQGIPTAALADFLHTYFPQPVTAPKGRSAASSAPVVAFDGDDAALLARAMSAPNGAKFCALWNGSTAGHPGASEADMALASLLAFWCGPDPARVENLMRRSGLVREKWDTRRGEGTYLSYTVGKALEGRTEFYRPPSIRSPRFEAQARKKGPIARIARNVAIGNTQGEIEREEREKTPFIGNISQNSQNGQESAQTAPEGFFSPSDPWEEVAPEEGQAPPPFPVHALPPVLRDFAAGLAANVGTAVDLPGVQSIAAVSATVQKRVVVSPKPGHVEPLTLWCVSVAPPGARKSAIMSQIARPLRAREARENERRRPEVEESAARQRAAVARRTSAERGIARANPTDDARAEFDDAIRAIAELRLVHPLRLLADDATPEALAVLMSQNGGRIAVLDAEGAAFGHMIGRYTDKPMVEIYLKGHSGEDHTQDRSGKEQRTVSVRGAALTIGCAVQPEILAQMRRRKETTGVGVLARCLFSFSEDTDAADEYLTPEMPAGADRAYRELLESLLGMEPAGERDEEGEPVPHRIGLEPDALDAFADFYREVQGRRREASGLLAEWLAKLHGATLRLAGVLHMARHGQDGATTPIGLESLRAAVELAWYFADHARVALARIREDEAGEGARSLLRWAGRHRREASEGVSERDLRTHLRSFSPEEMQAALYLLLSRGLVRQLAPPGREGKAGRLPSPRWQFHPSITWEVEA